MNKQEVISAFSGKDLRVNIKATKVFKAYQKGDCSKATIFNLVFSNDRFIAFRAIDTYEKIAKEEGVSKEEMKKLFGIMEGDKPKEFMWHYLQILGYMSLPNNMRAKIYNYLKTALNEYLESNIVRVMAMQSMYDLFKSDPGYAKHVKKILEEMNKSSIKSIHIRAKNLLLLYN